MAQPQVADRVAAMQAVIAGPCPDVAIGPHCHKPYACDLREYCRQDTMAMVDVLGVLRKIASRGRE